MIGGYAGREVVTSMVHRNIANDSQEDTRSAHGEATLVGLGALITSGDPENAKCSCRRRLNSEALDR